MHHSVSTTAAPDQLNRCPVGGVDAQLLVEVGEAIGSSYILDQSFGGAQLQIDGALVYVGIDSQVKVQRHGYPVFVLGPNTWDARRLAAAFTDAQTGVGA